jgi:hypothetical protein
MKRNKRAEKRRWAKWLKAFMAKTVEQIRADYDGK